MNEKFKTHQTRYFPLAIRSANESGHQRTHLTALERKMKIAELSEKTGYKPRHREHFFFLKKGEPVGWSIGENTNFMNYDMSNTGILPKHQNRGLDSIFLQTPTKYLKEIGYQRLCSQHSPDNRKMLITTLKAGVMVTGMDLDERWDSLVRITNLSKKTEQKRLATATGTARKQTTKKNKADYEQKK